MSLYILFSTEGNYELMKSQLRKLGLEVKDGSSISRDVLVMMPPEVAKGIKGAAPFWLMNCIANSYVFKIPR